MDAHEQSERWLDSTNELDEETESERDPDVQSIDLDCPPGHPRPGNLIAGVVEGTGLEIGEPVLKSFGNWRWEWRMPREEWEQRIVPLVKPRIIALYEKVAIRFGSW